MAQKQDSQSKVFAKYIADKRVLIADPSATARSSLASTLVNLGAKSTNITLASTFQAAEEEIARLHPPVVICDYDLGKRCGLDLLQRQRESNPETQKSLFVLVTGNTSQTAVARAAEEDVDTYILKPFTAEILRNSIIKAALFKLQPPEYIRVIEKGKNELADAKFDEAIKTFTHAMTLDSSPSLACFYLGQANQMKQALEVAEGSYLQGLEYNKIHYKCLIGLYEVLMAKKRHSEAYEVIKRISQYFPANPQRLNAVLRLAIQNRCYEDVERYYRIFTGIEERNEEMIKYICAALVICGKYYLNKGFGTRAIELFQKAAITASGRTKILREIIVALVETGMGKQAEEFLKRFPPESQSGVDFLAAQLQIADATMPPGIVIESARGLLTRRIEDPVIYQILIKRSAEAGFAESAEDLARAATGRWPDRKDLFTKALQARKG